VIAAARSISAQPRPGESTIIKCGNPAQIYNTSPLFHIDFGLLPPLGGVVMIDNGDKKFTGIYNTIWDTIGTLKILH